MICPNCGKELSGDSLFCSNCGAALNRSQPQDGSGAGRSTQTSYTPSAPYAASTTPTPQPGPQPAAGLATASQVCGILSLVLFCCLFFPLPIAAIVLGIIARVQGNRSGKPKAGIICGIVGLVLSIVVVVVYVTYVFSVYSSSGYYYW